MPKTRNELKNTEIIALSGKQYAGKDLLAQLIIAQFPDFKKIPLALAIKQAYGERHGFTLLEIEANKAQHRPGLIELGNWGRQQEPDYWLKQVLNQSGKKIISDVRLKREYDLLREHGAFLIRLNADRAIRAQRGQIVSEEDPTENELDAITDWDAILQNNGSLAELEQQLQTFFF